MTVRPRWWHQCGNPVDQCERCEHQGAGPVGAWLGAVVNQMPGVVLLPMFQSKGRARTVAQQPFQARLVGTLDTYRGVDREPAAMVPPAHCGSVTLVEQAAPHAGAQHLLPHPRLDLAHSGRIQPERGVKDDPGRPVGGARGLEYPVEDAAVKVQVRVQGRAEAVDEGHRPAAGRGAATGTVCAQAVCHRAQKDTQDGALHGRVTVQETAQGLGHCAHPLPHRQRRHDVIGQMRSRLHHAPGVARRTYATAFTGEGDQKTKFQCRLMRAARYAGTKIVPARGAVSAGKAMRQDAAFEIAAKGSFDVGGRWLLAWPCSECQPGLEVGLDGALP